ncbi:MAG: hypothetical protein PW788_00415 [Micavibrio sp.]|nr:hypothetical protein [Micavibrio sp.]
MDRDSKSLREIVGKYSPFIGGRTGWKGAALNAIAAPFAAANSSFQKLLRLPYPYGYENEAGQSLKDCGPEVPSTFRRMEMKLKTAFMAAALPASSIDMRRQFLDTAVEIRRDAADLSAHCTILRSEMDFVTEPYKFVLAKTENSLLLLEEGVASIRETLAPLKAEPQPVNNNSIHNNTLIEIPAAMRRTAVPSSLSV